MCVSLSSPSQHAGELSKREFREACIGLGLRGMDDSGIDAVFDTYDSDGGGYMDESEARDMIKGLQRIAEEAEHEKFRKAMEAQAMRRAAIKKAYSAVEPLPPDEPGGSSPLQGFATGGGAESPARTSPAATKGGKKSKSKKPPSRAAHDEVAAAEGAASTANQGLQHQPSPSNGDGPRPRAAPRLGPIREGGAAPAHAARTPIGSAGGGAGGGAGGAASSLLKSMGLGGLDAMLSSRREKAEQRKAVDAIVGKAAVRIAHLELARGFGTWAFVTTDTTRKLEVAMAAVRRLRNPKLNAALVRWIEHWEARREAMGEVEHCMYQLHHWPEIDALHGWRQVAAHSRQAAALRRRTIEAAGRLRHPELAAAFGQLKRRARASAAHSRLASSEFASQRRQRALCDALRACLGGFGTCVVRSPVSVTADPPRSVTIVVTPDHTPVAGATGTHKPASPPTPAKTAQPKR